MLDERFSNHTEDTTVSTGGREFSADPKADAGRNAVKSLRPLDEDGLKKWCLEGYLDPKTWRRTFGKDVLLSAFFNKRWFWIEFFEYVESLSAEAMAAIGWRIPWERASFAYRIKRSGYDRISPKNVCVWLWAIEENRARLVDDIGNLSAEGMRNWCHEWYENESGKRVYGKDVLIAAAESGDFWNEIDAYAERLGKISTRNAGGRFPRHPKMFADRFLNDGSQWITVARLFSELGVRMPKPERIRQSSKRFLSWTELREWCSKGYKSGVTGQRIFGKDVLLDALYSGKFWKEFERYVKSLGRLDVATIGWSIPCTPSGYDERVTSAGLPTWAKGTCLWFWALDVESAERCDDAWFLNGKWLVRWFREGYVSDDWKTVMGRDVLDWCFNSRSFWNSLEKYANGLTAAERRSMWGKFPKYAKSLGERTVGHDVAIDELYRWFGEETPDNRPKENPVSETGKTVGAFDGPRNSPFPPSLSKEARGRVRSFVRKVLELADPDKTAPLGATLFEIRETPSEIFVSCSNKRLLGRLAQYRAYVDDTLCSEASEWLEKPLGFEWKDFKKTGANENKE